MPRTPVLAPALPLVAILATALALAQWPSGEVTGRDRELVARVTRAGQQRFETDGTLTAADHGDVVESGLPVGALEVAAEAAADGGHAAAAGPAVAIPVEPPEMPFAPDVRLLTASPVVQARPASGAFPVSGRAPPLA